MVNRDTNSQNAKMVKIGFKKVFPSLSSPSIILPVDEASKAASVITAIYRLQIEHAFSDLQYVGI